MADLVGSTLATAAPSAEDHSHDFDFWMGKWISHSRRLKERLKGSKEWIEFDAKVEARALLSGFGNEDDFRPIEWQPGFVGMSFRLYTPKTQQWAIYWVDSNGRTLEPPVYGSFTGNIGHFEGDDQHEGTPVRVRFTWTRVDPTHARWEQAFTTDHGKTWETNWVMDHVKQP